MSDQVYNAGDIIGKTLIANIDIPVFTVPVDASQTVGFIKAGQPVGVVYSYLEPDPAKGRAYFYWAFQNAKGVTVPGGLYYTQHRANYYDVEALKQQGVISAWEQVQQEQDENKPWYEKVIRDYAKPVLIGAAGIYLGGQVIKGFFSRPVK